MPGRGCAQSWSVVVRHAHYGRTGAWNPLILSLLKDAYGGNINVKYALGHDHRNSRGKVKETSSSTLVSRVTFSGFRA